MIQTIFICPTELQYLMCQISSIGWITILIIHNIKMSIFAAGIPYAILGAAVGGSLGATAGIVGGAWAGGKIAENLKE